MQKNISKILFLSQIIINLWVFALLIEPVQAAPPLNLPNPIIIPTRPIPGAGSNPTNLLELRELLSIVGNFFVMIAPVLLVIALIYSGMLFMSAGASGAMVAKAKAALGYGILGGFIVFAAGVIINTIMAVVTRQFFCNFGINIPGVLTICIII